MAKYRVKHTSIMHNKTVYAEGSIVELTENQAKRLEDFVDLINEELINNNNKKNKNQTVKMTVKVDANKKDGEKSEEGDSSEEGDNKDDEQNV